MVEASSHVPLFFPWWRVPKGWVYGRRLVFVSERTNKRHHHHIGWSIRDHCEHVVEEFSLLKQDVASSIKKFAHPGTSRNLRKTEVETVQNSIKKLLSLINGKLTIYQGRQRGTQADVNHF